jgi:hypothetical protein
MPHSGSVQDQVQNNDNDNDNDNDKKNSNDSSTIAAILADGKERLKRWEEVHGGGANAGSGLMAFFFPEVPDQNHGAPR